MTTRTDTLLEAERLLRTCSAGEEAMQARQALTRCRSLLAAHRVQLNDRGGIMEDVQDAAPRLSPRLQELSRRLDGLLGETARLVDRCAAGDDVRRDLDAVADRISEIRHGELGVLLDAFEVDVAPGD